MFRLKISLSILRNKRHRLWLPLMMVETSSLICQENRMYQGRVEDPARRWLPNKRAKTRKSSRCLGVKMTMMARSTMANTTTRRIKLNSDSLRATRDDGFLIRFKFEKLTCFLRKLRELIIYQFNNSIF